MPIVIGVMRDKHVPDILAALAPVASSFICTAAKSPRAASPEDAGCRRSGAWRPDYRVDVAANPLEAVALAAARGNPVVVAGSLYLAGEIRAKCRDIFEPPRDDRVLSRSAGSSWPCAF